MPHHELKLCGRCGNSMTSVLLNAPQLGPPVWTLLDTYSDAILNIAHRKLKPCGRCGNNTISRFLPFE